MGYHDVGPEIDKSMTKNQLELMQIQIIEHPKVDTAKLKRFYYDSPYSIRIYLKTAYILMNMKPMPTKDEKKAAKRMFGKKPPTEILNKPLVPPCFKQNENLISLEQAKLVVKQVLNEEKIDDMRVMEIMKAFQNVIYSDCYERMQD